jgi:hypothetical protein
LDLKGDNVQVKVPKAKKAAKGSRKKVKGTGTSTGATKDSAMTKGAKKGTRKRKAVEEACICQCQ